MILTAWLLLIVIIRENQGPKAEQVLLVHQAASQRDPR